MKKVLAIIILSMLSGCAAMDAYFMAKFDQNEYQLINDVRSLSQIGSEFCSNQQQMVPIVDRIYLKSIEFKNYAEFIPENKATIKLSESLMDLTEPLHVRYHKTEKISEAYCKQKMDILSKAATTIAQTIGSKPR